jgi:hypothetical protein
MMMSASVGAASLVELHFKRDGRHFELQTVTQLEVAAAHADAVLQDFAQFHRLNSAIRNSQVLAVTPNGATQLHVDLHGCVWFFCKDMTWVGNIQRLPSGGVEAVTDVARSSFKAGTSRWRVRPAAVGRSRFEFSASFTTSFWVPPVIGTWLIKRKLEQEVMEMSQNIERFAWGHEHE